MKLWACTLNSLWQIQVNLPTLSRQLLSSHPWHVSLIQQDDVANLSVVSFLLVRFCLCPGVREETLQVGAGETFGVGGMGQ